MDGSNKFCYHEVSCYNAWNFRQLPQAPDQILAAQKVLEVESTSKTLAKDYTGKGENHPGSVSAAPAFVPDMDRKAEPVSLPPNTTPEWVDLYTGTWTPNII